MALILTKTDLVQSSPNQVRADGDFADLHANLETLFGHVFSTIQAFKIAASPKTDVMPRGTGVSELLAFWLEPAVVEPTPPPARPSFARAFARLRPLDEPKGEG